MDTLKQHFDTVLIIFSILTSVFAGFLWMNGKFNEIEKELTVIKTVLVVKGIYPNELCKNDHKQSIIKP